MSLIKLCCCCVSCCSSSPRSDPACLLGVRREGWRALNASGTQTKSSGRERANLASSTFVPPHPCNEDPKLAKSKRSVPPQRAGIGQSHLFAPRGTNSAQKSQTYWCFIRPRLQGIETGIGALLAFICSA